ncbi:hypothetical protein BKA59DRAFT_471355 [Fusarium tricinctum]|uniref:F-box domain-containing protein n=1 Tax=Fusarium tricinctum TaxID=61284 RepID=A0A8K0WCD8_9HYPO|nr:hypothetical protein BKA59DRAFT_471355 [Fusarium tricinctum]
MSTITELPVNILLLILKYLNPFDLECVAKTFNKTLHNASFRLLAPHKEWISNARHMAGLFQPKKFNDHCTRRLLPSFPGHLHPLKTDTTLEEIPHRDYEAFGLDPESRPYIRSSPAELRTWMKLDGSLAWLQPLEKELQEIVAVHTGHEVDRRLAEDKDIQVLTKQAEDRKLMLPPGFLPFIRSNQFHHRIASTSAWFFRLKKMIPCPPEVDGGEGGYLIRFHCDHQYCAFAYVYLSPNSGHHCVLFSYLDLYEDEDEDHAGTGEALKDDFLLCALTFEEYLVERYYTETLLYRHHYTRGTPSVGLKSFVRSVYRSPVEVTNLREHSKSSSVVPAVSSFLRH